MENGGVILRRGFRSNGVALKLSKPNFNTHTNRLHSIPFRLKRFLIAQPAGVTAVELTFFFLEKSQTLFFSTPISLDLIFILHSITMFNTQTHTPLI